MKRVILDTGPLVAFFSPRDAHHTWALEQTRTIAAPLITCEAVLTETYHLLGRVPRARAAFRQWMGMDRVVTPLDFSAESAAVMDLLDQYADQPMDFADACIVRLAELLQLPVFTLDRSDFLVYRLNQRDAIPLIAPAP